ncbi:MAG: DOMON-like domain-containing protein [Rhizomicrobium sp.]
MKAVRLGNDTLNVRYLVSGEIGNLLLPPSAIGRRTNDLWRHTCFEAFLCAPPDAGYCEFNFSPSTQWAAWRFETYRSGRRGLDVAAPRINIRSNAAQFELSAALPMNGVSTFRAALWNLGLSAVIEETNEHLSYWALAHPPGRADFHCAETFALELAPAARVGT